MWKGLAILALVPLTFVGSVCASAAQTTDLGFNPNTGIHYYAAGNSIVHGSVNGFRDTRMVDGELVTMQAVSFGRFAGAVRTTTSEQEALLWHQQYD